MQNTQQKFNDTPNESSTFVETGFIDDFPKSGVSGIWSSITKKVKKLYGKATDSVDDEFSIPVSQDQVNDALKKFVTRNVRAILELRVEMHEGWFRLYCTFEAKGIYAEVASNFELVHVQIDRNVQRFVFGQQTYTDVLSLRCDSVLKRYGLKLFIWFYHSILKRDPLGFILHKINIVKPKDNILYLDINRWLKRNKKIMSTLQKVQVNYGIVEEEQLVLKTQVNIRDLISNSDGEEIITPKDEPELLKGPLNPINDAVKPSEAQ